MGFCGPRIECQIISLRTRSSAASSFVKFILSETFPPQAVFKFLAARSTMTGAVLYGRRSGLLWNEFNIGVAAASNWDIGFNPRICSIVRNMLLVEYIVESTVPRLM